MERRQDSILLEKGGVEIPQEIIDKIGCELKSTCINNVWLLITSLDDSRVSGEPLRFNKNDSVYMLPENQLSALQLKQGDEVKVVYSEELRFIIIQKLGIGFEDEKNKKVKLNNINK